MRLSGKVEYMGVLRDNYEDYDLVDDEDETLDLMTDDFIIEHLESIDLCTLKGVEVYIVF